MATPIHFQACNGLHTIKREHLDEEGGRTTFDADEHDLWQAGYVKVATVREHIEANDLEALEDFFCEGPDDGELSDAAIEHAAKLEQARTLGYQSKSDGGSDV